MNGAGNAPVRLAVAVGHTLGHVHPALAFLEAYRNRTRIAPVVFGPDCDESRRLVEGAGWRFVAVAARPWQGGSLFGKALAGLRAALGFAQTRRHLANHRAECVVGFGGYASGPVLLAGRSLGAALAIHEANVEPGMTNRWLAPFVDRVFVSQPASAWPGPRGRSLLAGVPIRPGFAALAADPHALRAQGDPFRLLVTSGSRGADFLARKVPSLVGQLRATGVPLEIRQQADAADLGPLRDAYARLGVPARVDGYVEDMAAACAWAHLGICRGGAGTLAELAAGGLPAIVVPLADASEDHQAANARAFAGTGAGVIVRESEWNTDALAEQVTRWAGDPAAWRRASQQAQSMARPEASQVMVVDCEELLRGRVAR